MRHVIGAVAAVFFIAVASPVAALAGNGGKCNASACKVYIEPNAPSAGKQQPPSQTGSGGHGTHAPKNLARALSQAGKDRGPLKQLLTDSNLGSLRGGANAASPSLLGAAFDLGAGPLVLLSILGATAFGIAVRGSVQSWLRRRTSV
jgi:hypothetical protein